ncbi:uncharacterized protein BXZ73DRAFT_40576 [Epithele typhae]|uniref:uncharacterized protein n=1 Tax=Epithele typhae TaxID=378194 RepID=UPI002008AA27|nr:uncharacterized protein BXZ73DRAFT_40576 [Epithele typhae]KAH9943155.1 hypothetical protein BXZ73DRAFT_40576 [Epithele typhae]
MALVQTPRKTVPLAMEDEHIPRPKPKSHSPDVTRRVFFCGVVVEGTEGGRELSLDVKELIASLGESIDLVPASTNSSPSTTDMKQVRIKRRRAMTNTSALADITKELVTTERTYVKKLRVLKKEYADPLREFSKNKHTAIVPPYQAKAIFGNIDKLLPVNEAFLTDLEKMDRDGTPGVGDIAIKHFKTLKAFECYREYFAKHEEVQKLFEHEVKKNSRFAEYIDRVKYSTASDARNKFGLVELLAEPWQRIPRYTLMFNTMLKHMAMNHPQRSQLEEAIQHASDIAKAETDPQMKRMGIMHCLATSIENFPMDLVSSSRHFIDCIDVQDVVAPDPHAPVSSNGPTGALTLHCSLFLFNDKLMIVKRPADKSGKALSGLDQLDKVVKGGALPSSMRKSGLVCKGVLDITDVAATEVGGADFHLFLENPLWDQTEKWAGRQFRSLSVVFPPAAVHLDPIRTANEKRRFLDAVWLAQARFRTRAERSIVLRGEEFEVENRGGYVTYASTYYNVYTRTNFLQEPKKTKIVLHIDQDGIADAVPFGESEGPYVVVRVQPIAGALARYNVTSSYEDEPEEDIMQPGRIPERIVQTIQQYGLFKFKTGALSRPTTPTVSRSRAAIFGLDVISRNLFGARSTSGGMSDFFGGSMNGHRRARTADSRSSTLTGSGSTTGSSISQFSRASTTTVATSLMDDEPPPSLTKSTRSSRTRSLSRGAKKLIKRAKSPFQSDYEDAVDSDDAGPPSAYDSASMKRGRSASAGEAMTVDASERDLARRLELARKNSQNQHGREYESLAMQEPVEDTIYEGSSDLGLLFTDDPPPAQRPLSRVSRMSRALPELPQDYDYAASQRSTTPTIRAQSPALSESSRRARSLSRHSSDRSDRRPMGPRSPSPLPRSPRSAHSRMPSADSDTEPDNTQPMFPTTPMRTVFPRTPIPRSKRQPFEPTSAVNTDMTPKAAATEDDDRRSMESTKLPGLIEPLAIKKRSSVRTNASTATITDSPATPAHRPPQLARRPSPYQKGPSVKSQTTRTSGNRTTVPTKLPRAEEDDVDLDELQSVVKRSAEAIKADIEDSHRAIKKIRLETQKVATSSPVRAAVVARETNPPSPVKRSQPLTPQRPSSPAWTREALTRREEMLQAIGKRASVDISSGGPPRIRTALGPSSSASSLFSASSTSGSQTDCELANFVDDVAEEAEHKLDSALRHQEEAESEVRRLMRLLRDRTDDLVKTGLGLQNWKRQYEVVSQLLANSQQEVNELYQYFNEELEGMFDAASLPDDDAWAAMTRKVKEAQQGKARVEQENSQLKTRIAELEIQQEQWAALLREHGLIS